MAALTRTLSQSLLHNSKMLMRGFNNSSSNLHERAREYELLAGEAQHKIEQTVDALTDRLHYRRGSVMMHQIKMDNSKDDTHNLLQVPQETWHMPWT